MPPQEDAKREVGGHRGERTSRITLVSTHAVDRVPQEDGSFLEMPGGPAHYAGDALRRLGCPFTLVSGEVARVQVLFGPFGQDYLIPPLRCIDLPSAFVTEATILSPIMQEIDPTKVPATHGILAIDLQGFVRVPNTPFHQVSAYFSLEPLLHQATLVKASHEEIERLDLGSRQALHEKMVLVTHGARGLALRRDGREDFIPAAPLPVTNTIGAGDTLLSAVVFYLLEGLHDVQAVTHAMRFVEFVLQEREEQTALIARRGAAP